MDVKQAESDDDVELVLEDVELGIKWGEDDFSRWGRVLTDREGDLAGARGGRPAREGDDIEGFMEDKVVRMAAFEARGAVDACCITSASSRSIVDSIVLKSV